MVWMDKAADKSDTVQLTVQGLLGLANGLSALTVKCRKHAHRRTESF